MPAAHHNEPRPAAGDAIGGASPRPGFSRGPEVRDAVAEMAERAQLIGQEAGTKIASAMRDVITTAAGIAGFAVESVRDLVQYMVRRGQMTQDEADQLIREAEEARGRRLPKSAPKSEPRAATAAAPAKEASAPRGAAKTAKKAAAPKSSAAASEKKPAAKKTAGKKRR